MSDDPVTEGDPLLAVQAHAEIDAGAGNVIDQGNGIAGSLGQANAAMRLGDECRIAEQLHAAERHVGPVLTDEMFEMFFKLKKVGKTILLVEQNVQAALTVADRAYITDQGMAVHNDTAARLLASTEIQERYCGVSWAGPRLRRRFNTEGE